MCRPAARGPRSHPPELNPPANGSDDDDDHEHPPTTAMPPKPALRLRTGLRAGYTDDACMDNIVHPAGPRRLTR